MASYYVITESGLNELMIEVKEKVKYPDNQIANGWAEYAEHSANGKNGFDEIGTPAIEVRAMDSLSGRPEIIDLPRRWFELS